MWERFIEPMKPVSHPQVFANDRFLYQVKWDGVRMLSYIEKGQVTLINKNLKDKTLQFPELSALSNLLKEKRAVLDGELVVLKDGRPHFPSILRRNFGSIPTQINLLSKRLPVIYMIFDLIILGDRDLRREPLEIRTSLLNDCVNWQEPFHVVESFADGAKLFAAVKESDLEGVVAKRKSSPYTEGKKHNDWLKIKYRKRRSFVIGGFTSKQNRINALVIGLFDHNADPAGLYYVGRAGTGLKEQQWDLLSAELPKLKTERSPFINLKASQLKEAVFIEPVLTAEIEYAELTDNLYIRAPVIIGFSPVSPEECHF
ncbi:MAG: hypothetical protein GX808_01770 [Syntrophomonadaceae bacterium]|jgi:bifunctional non-homologous end joining protein LigD|nr:hypothetical protein [Syntrophomonadaceae bacterium]